MHVEQRQHAAHNPAWRHAACRQREQRAGRLARVGARCEPLEVDGDVIGAGDEFVEVALLDQEAWDVRGDIARWAPPKERLEGVPRQPGERRRVPARRLAQEGTR